MIVYDCTDAESCTQVDEWLDEVNMFTKEDSIRVLVGNKADCFESDDDSNATDATPVETTAITVPEKTTDSNSARSDNAISPSEKKDAENIDEIDQGEHDEKEATAAADQGQSASKKSAPSPLSLAVQNLGQNPSTRTRAVPSAHGERLAIDRGMLFFETSAKTGENIQATFEATLQALIAREQSRMTVTKMSKSKPRDLHTGAVGYADRQRQRHAWQSTTQQQEQQQQEAKGPRIPHNTWTGLKEAGSALSMSFGGFGQEDKNRRNREASKTKRASKYQTQPLPVVLGSNYPHRVVDDQCPVCWG
jgi:GTPase SAR1 family protein